ncbi:hypothetical protein RHSIM_Rhsim06G0014700 [Rhododendron simsii]|uniref:non-specific serine/threonine protein kinase n=1 Tax=Rhododendron simsii TaxID=118357 RepID=A0A834GQB6_RHOSS|nr:hypothetical protein RHSIM_Rhsim06G0014700 [Rhododendron simsii]
MGLCASLRALCYSCCSKQTTQEITSQDSPHPPATQEPPEPKPDPPKPPPSSSSYSQIGPILRKPYVDMTQIYDLDKELGRGEVGITYLCTEKSTGLKYACKSISRRKLVTDKEIEDVRREIAILEHLRGQPNIIEFKGAYEDRSNLHLVMELCSGGELFNRIVAKGSYSEKVRRGLGGSVVNMVPVSLEEGVVLARCLAEALLKKPRNEIQNEEEEYGRIKKGLEKFAKERRWRSFSLISAAYVVGFIQETDGKVMRFLKEKFLSRFTISSVGKMADFHCGELNISGRSNQSVLASGRLKLETKEFEDAIGVLENKEEDIVIVGAGMAESITALGLHRFQVFSSVSGLRV